MSEQRNASVENISVIFQPSKQDKENGLSHIDSSAFVLQRSESNIKVVSGWETAADRKIKTYLKARPPLSEEYYVTVSLLKGNKSISYPKSKIPDPHRCFWSTPFQEVANEFGEIDKWNFTFKFLFEKELQTNLHQKNSGHKFVQTTPYLNKYDSIQRLSDDLARFYDGSTGSDVELKSGGVAIKAHKSMLISRSSYFRKILQASPTNSIDLPYIDPATFHEIIRFIYTGQTPNLSFELAKKIFKSGICDAGSLSELCVQFMTENLTVDNACDCLALSDDDSFREVIVAYIIEKEIPFLDEYWKPFCDKHSELANFVYAKLVRKLRSSNRQP